MLILVAVTVTITKDGGLFTTARTAQKDTAYNAEQENLLMYMYGEDYNATTGLLNLEGVKAKLETDNSTSNRWASITLNDTKTELTVVGTQSGKKHTIDSKGNVSNGNNSSTTVETLTWEEARASKWCAMEEKGDILTFCGLNEKNISLTQTINNVAFFEEVTKGEENGSPITEMQFKGYQNIDITGENTYITFFENENIEQVNLNGLNVNLESECFVACENIKSVTGMEGIEEIPSNAFEGCTSLTDITIPSNITSIGSNAFSSCTNLTQITINKAQDSISGAPWGAPNATVTWRE